MESLSRTWLAPVLLAAALGEGPICAETADAGRAPDLSQLLATLHMTGAGVLVWLTSRPMRNIKSRPRWSGYATTAVACI